MCIYEKVLVKSFRKQAKCFPPKIKDFAWNRNVEAAFPAFQIKLFDYLD